MNDADDAVKAIINNNMEWYEFVLLACAIKRPTFYINFCKERICPTRKGNLLFYDFTKPVDNELFKLAVSYYSCFEDEKDIPKEGVPAFWFDDFLQNMVNNYTMTSDVMVIAKQRVAELYNVEVDPIQVLISSGVDYWLDVRRTKQITVRGSHKILTADEIIEELRTSSKQISSGRTRSFKASEIFYNTELQTERIQTGLRDLDNSIGGIGKREGILFIAPPGGGKTVMACQLAVNVAVLKKHVKLITTEQPPHELLPRMISSQCNIPFKSVRDGDYSSLNSGHQALIQKFLEEVDDHLDISDWTSHEKNINVDLEREIEEAISNGRKPEVIIFDWIGGGMGHLSTMELSIYRAKLLQTAAKLNTIARSYDIGVVAMSQADAKLAKNKERVDSSMISECKMLHRDFTMAIGVSCLETEEEKDNITNFLPRQKLHVFKGRKSDPVTIDVIRRFQYQRFEDFHTNDLDHSGTNLLPTSY